ncbi:MAG TPA: HAD-IA family hydrolase [Candidatus Saccharimonadales bacterium]
MDEKGLGKRLQEARQAAGLTQQQLCARANLSFSTLTKIERGAIKAPSIFTVQAIAGAIGLSLDELIGVPSLPARDLKKTRDGVSFVYFDINGSLVHFFQQAFTQAAEDYDVAANLVESNYWRFNDEVCRGTMSLDDFNQLMDERLQIKGFDWRKYYLDALEPIEPLQELLEWASEHYKVGILSNIMPGLISAMREAGKLPNVHYDVIIDSSQVGTIKPEPQIYEIATKEAGVPPEEIMLIDDTRGNLVAAEKAGWHGLLFDDYQMQETIVKLREALEPAES